MPLLLWLSSIGALLFSALARFVALWPVFLLWISQRITFRTGLVLLYVGGTIALYEAFIALLLSLVSVLASSIPSEFTTLFSNYAPENFSQCLGIMLSAKIVQLVYLWWRHLYEKFLDSSMGV